MDQTASFYVYGKNGEQLATIVLNGLQIDSSGPLGHQGKIRSFMILEGDLWDEWSTQDILQMSNQEGYEAAIRIAAFPAEEGSAGLVEFV